GRDGKASHREDTTAEHPRTRRTLGRCYGRGERGGALTDRRHRGRPSPLREPATAGAGSARRRVAALRRVGQSPQITPAIWHVIESRHGQPGAREQPLREPCGATPPPKPPQRIST